MRISLGKKLLTIVPGIVLAIAVFIGMPTVSMAYQPTVGIVSAAAAKVRKEPNTSSDVVGSLLKGSSVTITDEVTDSAGSVWYKVTVESSTGYIRSDLLIKATVSAPNTQTQTVALSASSTKPAATAATPIAETKAYVNYKSVVVRQGASTDHEIMGSVVENTPVIITGEAKANNGKKWYQIRYTNQSGREVVGFVRADLLTVGDPPAASAPAQPQEEPAAPAEGEGGEEAPAENPEEGGEEAAPEEPPAEEPAPEEPMPKPDYEMVFTQNDEGVEEWFLYDNINGTRQALSNLQAAAEAGANKGEVDSDQLATQKIIIIVLAVAVSILAVTVVLLLFKIKDLYSDDDYDDDDDDEEDDDDDDDDEEDDDGDEDVVEEKKPKKRSIADNLKAVNNAGSVKIAREKEKGNLTIKNVEYIPEEEPFEPGKPIAPQPKRKAKNFLIDDDEFEFEFLNMDDRD